MMKKRLRKKWLRRRIRRLTKEAMAPIARSAVVMPRHAEIYSSEIRYLIGCIIDRPDIETGGELFGFWKDDGTPVVAYALGPGPKANHQTAFFNQDMDYLLRAGGLLTGKYGLEHIGEWHSHHRLGLAHPSGHDAATIANGIRVRRRNRFLLCIGTLAGSSASLGGFVFAAGGVKSYAHVDWRVLGIPSPFRSAVDSDPSVTEVLVHPVNIEGGRNGTTPL